jgi:hypothetical protein
MLCAVAAALLGAAIGYFFGRSGSSAADPMIDLFATVQSRYSSYVFGVRKDGDNDAHERDLRSYLAYLDARVRESGSANANLYAFDKALALVRLSQIAQARGATVEADQIRKDADAKCVSTGLRNCSANYLLFIARQRDRNAWGNAESIGIPQNVKH